MDKKITKQTNPKNRTNKDKDIAYNIFCYRKKKKYSREDMSELLGVTAQQISKYELGKNKVPASRLYEISQILGVSIEKLYIQAKYKYTFYHKDDPKKLVFQGDTLNGQDLSNANLFGHNFYGVDFSNSNLSNAYLLCAKLKHADFSGTNLSNANLSGAFLKQANFKRAILNGAKFQWAYLKNNINLDVLKINKEGIYHEGI